MRIPLIYLVFIFAITAWSCENNDNNNCDGIDCFTPPSPFYFELVDKTSGENLFTTGVLNADDIKVINLDDQSNVDFDFIDENDANIIRIHTIGWETQIANYSIESSTEHLFTLYVDAEVINENCCAYTRYNEIGIDGLDFEQNEHSGVYQILVE
ncbi:hypothetical protein [uncultured Draconibacterium sp.]|uniref:hypothetical protein n=1 Tax=uncultured Draconibacterium sp. TaxID=1573823 RepID=UPI0025D043D1|nr:hypothetical protein [uncultured Draconibacterium sp.]